MSKVKYKEYFNKMVDDNKSAFEKFKKLHDNYTINQDSLQNKFNEEGEQILELIHEYENRLCANTERGMYNKYSAGLSEKFQAEVKKHFPMIDHVGLITQNPKLSESKEFVLKKIDLS